MAANTLVLKLDALKLCHNQNRRLQADHWRDDGTCKCHPPRDDREPEE